MALRGNYSVLNKTPGRLLSGNVASDTRAAWNAPGAMRGRYVQTGGFSALSSVPSGYRPPYSWQIAIKSGALASTNLIIGAGDLAAAGAMGVNGSVTIAGLGDVNAIGQLVVSAVAALTGSGDIANANLLAVLNAAASLAGSGDLAGAMNALGWATVVAAGTGDVSSTLTATGTMAAAILPYTDLSPEALAASVWSSTEGAFLYAVAHNRVVTDPVAGTITIYDTDDTTVLYSAALWADADGTTPYSGSGAERRDRLA